MTVPVLRSSPYPLLVQQWRGVYNKGKSFAPPLATAAAAALAFVAYTRFQGAGGESGEWKFLTGAAVGVVANNPFTMLALAPINAILIKESEKPGTISEDEARALLDKWSKLNIVRGLLPLTAAVLGARAIA